MKLLVVYCSIALFSLTANATTCNTGCVQNYTYFSSTTGWAGSWFSKSTSFCSRTAGSWLDLAKAAQNSSQTTNNFIVANYITTYLNYETAGACASLAMKVMVAAMRTNYMVPAQNPNHSVCTGGVDSFNALLVSSRSTWATAFYNYVTGVDHGPELCSPPSI